jgi:adenylate cyclase
MAWNTMAEVALGTTKDRKGTMKRACEWARKAVELDPRDYMGHYAQYYCFRRTKQYEAMRRAAETTLRLNPMEPRLTVGYATGIMLADGRADEAIARLKRLERINPKGGVRSVIFMGLAQAYYHVGEFEEALSYLSRMSDNYRKWVDMRLLAIAAYYHAGQVDRARELAKLFLSDQPDYSIEAFEKSSIVTAAKSRTTIKQALRQLGVPERAQAKKPSIAVLPFANLSDDREQEYFADGIAEDIITDLSKLSGLFVIARNSSFRYRGKDIDIKKVGSELGVRFVLEGSVRRVANQTRINAQLIDARTGGHLWAERYDGSLSDIFALQDEVTRKIVTALSVALTSSEKTRLSEQRSVDIATYDLLKKAQKKLWLQKPEANIEAQKLFKQAIAIDPKHADAYAGLALTHWYLYRGLRIDGISHTSAEETAFELAHKSLSIRPNSLAHRTLAMIHLWGRRQHREALAEGRKALRINPNDGDSRTVMAEILVYTGKPSEALDLVAEAKRQNPFHPARYVLTSALANFGAGRYQQAIADLNHVIEQKPEWSTWSGLPGIRIRLAAAYAHIGRQQDAEATVRYLMTNIPGFSLQNVLILEPYQELAHADTLIDGLRRAGLPEQ